MINIGLYLEVCIIFMEISIFWQVSLFQFLLPGQFVVSEAPGMKCPSIAINEKVACLQQAQNFIFIYSEEEILFALGKNTVQWSEFRKKGIIG